MATTKSPSPFTVVSGLMFSIPRGYHWTWNRRGRMTLHRGHDPQKCTRVHYNSGGKKEPRP